MAVAEAIYGGDADTVCMKWPECFDHLLSLAHPHRQMVPHETRAAAERVLAKHGWEIDTPEALRDFLDAFDSPFKHQARSRYIPAEVRAAVMERDNGVCQACGSTENPTLDHIKPFSRGGRHTPQNLRVLCLSCNSSKHNRTDEEWRGADG